MGNESGKVQSQSLAELIPLAYEELRRVARQRMAQLRPGATLSPTDLVNEVLLRLLKQSKHVYNGTDHLIRVAALAMHNVLVDQARQRGAVKRHGTGRRVEMDQEDLAIASPADNMLVFDEVCQSLRARSEAHFELVLLRVYAGLSTEEIAAQRGQSTRTVERHWRIIKTILGQQVKTRDAALA